MGALLKETRIKKRLTQADLAGQSGVSISTIVKLEQSLSARFDAVVRLAHALGQSVETWLRLAGHQGVSAERIAAIISQQRIQEPGLLARFEDPIEHFTQLCEELRKREAPALACAIFTSKPAAVGRPQLRQKLLELTEAGMHFAFICPYPQPVDIPSAYLTTKPSLVGLYAQVFGWIRQLAGELSRELSEEQRRHIAVFVPKSPSRSVAKQEHEALPVRLVPPPLLVTEYQPVLFRLCAGRSGQPERIELGAYARFGGKRPDQWIVLYPREGEEQERAEEFKNLWQDLCGDILQAWQPKGADTVWADDRLADWARL